MNPETFRTRAEGAGDLEKAMSILGTDKLGNLCEQVGITDVIELGPRATRRPAPYIGIACLLRRKHGKGSILCVRSPHQCAPAGSGDLCLCIDHPGSWSRLGHADNSTRSSKNSDLGNPHIHKGLWPAKSPSPTPADPDKGTRVHRAERARLRSVGL
ncbi:hypothetical protein ABVK25_011576 [Lepraria finkii]|uniref:Uncharacterized protein n=1 Tax=Lepraria finkii TaxID=1340010 RepID=A0ABR4APJ9_9LECA